MTVKELKEAIANLPDDMGVMIEVATPTDIKWDGAATSTITTEQFNDMFWLTAYFKNNENNHD